LKIDSLFDIEKQPFRNVILKVLSYAQPEVISQVAQETIVNKFAVEEKNERKGEHEEERQLERLDIIENI
jgi:hypothetical protein